MVVWYRSVGDGDSRSYAVSWYTGREDVSTTAGWLPHGQTSDLFTGSVSVDTYVYVPVSQIISAFLTALSQMLITSRK